jgi:hypothetical protein
MPSHTDTCGFGLPPIAALRQYSSRKNESVSGGSAAEKSAPPFPASHTARTSPPAQKAFPPAPSMSRQCTLGSAAAAWKADQSERIMGKVRALRALGLSSINEVHVPRVSICTSVLIFRVAAGTHKREDASRRLTSM